MNVSHLDRSYLQLRHCHIIRQHFWYPIRLLSKDKFEFAKEISERNKGLIHTSPHVEFPDTYNPLVEIYVVCK